MNKGSRVMLVSFIVALFICMAPAASGFAAETDKFVDVEAEGQGETKIQAMKAAWMEAVRLGIGMYLDAKTTVIDDAAKEEIVTHSRGRVDSYEELGSEKTDAGWKVRIRAKIEKDVLKETADSIQSKKVAINPNLAAQAISEREKKLSGKELIAAYQMPPWEKFFSLDLQATQKDGQYVGNFVFRVNMDMYTKVFVEDFVKILDQVAINKKEGRFDGKMSEEMKARIREGKKPQNNSLDQDAFRKILRSQKPTEEVTPILIVVNMFKYILYSVPKEIGPAVAAKTVEVFAAQIAKTQNVEKAYSDMYYYHKKKILFSIDIMEKNNLIDSFSTSAGMTDFIVSVDTYYKPTGIVIKPLYNIETVGQEVVGYNELRANNIHQTVFTLPMKLSKEYMDKADSFVGSFHFE